MSLSTHVLDTAQGRPAVGLTVRLETQGDDGWRVIDSQHTDTDGRVRDWQQQPGEGTHRLVFDTAGYLGPDAFFPEVAVAFRMSGDENEHYHVPLLLSPFGYSTYRGT